MIPSKTLIEALRKAADRIEYPRSDYRWSTAEACNCGLVARELLGLTALEVAMATRKQGFHTWSYLCRTASCCVMTGAPVPEIFQQLTSVGLERDDLIALENLSNVTVRERAGLQTRHHYQSIDTGEETFGDYSDPRAVVAYLRAWASILAEQLAQQEQNNLRQCGASENEGQCIAERMKLADTERSVAPVALSPLPLSPSPVTAALAKQMPCYHLYLGGCCVYCGTTEPVERKELV